MQQTPKKHFSIARLGLALVFIILAILVLMEMIGWVKTETILGQYWPALFIFLGIITMQPSQGQNNGFSYGLATIGTLLLLRNLGVFNSTNGRIVLTILLLVCGLGVLTMATNKKPSD